MGTASQGGEGHGVGGADEIVRTTGVGRWRVRQRVDQAVAQGQASGSGEDTRDREAIGPVDRQVFDHRGGGPGPTEHAGRCPRHQRVADVDRGARGQADGFTHIHELRVS